MCLNNVCITLCLFYLIWLTDDHLFYIRDRVDRGPGAHSRRPRQEDIAAVSEGVCGLKGRGVFALLQGHSRRVPVPSSVWNSLSEARRLHCHERHRVLVRGPRRVRADQIHRLEGQPRADGAMRGDFVCFSCNGMWLCSAFRLKAEAAESLSSRISTATSSWGSRYEGIFLAIRFLA